MTDYHIINPPLTQITNQCLPRHRLLPNTNPNPSLSFSLFRTNPLCSRRPWPPYHVRLPLQLARRSPVAPLPVTRPPHVAAIGVRDIFIFSARPAATTTPRRHSQAQRPPSSRVTSPARAFGNTSAPASISRKNHRFQTGATQKHHLRILYLPEPPQKLWQHLHQLPPPSFFHLKHHGCTFVAPWRTHLRKLCVCNSSTVVPRLELVRSSLLPQNRHAGNSHAFTIPSSALGEASPFATIGTTPHSTCSGQHHLQL